MNPRRSPLLGLLVLAQAASAAVAGGDRGASPALSPEVQKLVNEGLKLEDAGKFEEAIKLNQKILVIDPHEKRAMNTIAGLYGKMQKYDDELHWAKKTIEADPSYWPAYVNFGNAQIGLGQPELARRSYQQARDLAPEDAIPVYSLGTVEETEGHIEKALADYAESARLDPTCADCFFSLGAMHANLKHWDEAKKALSKVLAIDPNAEDAKKMLRDIEAASEGR